VVGLQVYAPTAWFAIFEVGLPSALLGSVLGLVVGVSKHRASKRRSHLPDR
jgi:hypothetical protein